MKIAKQIFTIIIFVLFICLLALLQITIVNRYPIGGVKLNLVLIGLVANLFNPHFEMIILGAIAGGLIYDFSGLFNFISLFSFILMLVLLRLWSKKYLVKKNILIIFVFGLIGTVIFNFFYVLMGYFFFHENFFPYFLSSKQLIEMLLNGSGALILALVGEGFSQIVHLFKKK
ncbi:MAG: hypothetical protein PHF40_00960 [Candidatus Pacebacteria bacterium]|nr:hypothetical protein [Candidatus Paceibacterota bacterium]